MNEMYINFALSAFELGYKACEDGKNIEAGKQELLKLIAKTEDKNENKKV